MYRIKHKDIDVLLFDYSTKVENCTVINKEHLPLYFIDKYTLESNVHEWLMTRCIPQNRKFYNRLINSFDTTDILRIPLETGALSLTDCYWIAKDNDNRTWSEVNFFENEFDSLLDHIYLSPQFGLMRGNRIELTKLINPSQTLQGSLPKVWRIDNNKKRYLLKGCLNSSEVTNECLVSDMLNNNLYNRLDNANEHKAILYGKELDERQNKYLAKCYNFISNNEDFISADELFEYHLFNIKDVHEYSVENLIKVSEQYIEGFRNQVDFIRVLDFLICNEDRHWNNLGFIRDADTLKIKRVAPIYDNGYSFFNDYDIADERTKYDNLEEIASFFDSCSLKKALNYIQTKPSDYLKLNHMRGFLINPSEFSGERVFVYNRYLEWAFSYLDKMHIQY